MLALVSGGADSTLLAHALIALGHPIETLHVAHGLRGAESDADAAACRELAAGLGVRHHEVAGPVAPGAGVEARARAHRRAAASALRDGRAVATGHTRDDRVETILYRLAASPGSAAFAALPAAGAEGRVRPLIELGRDEVRAALQRAGIPWRDDSSNLDRSFVRNRVRLDLLPAFRSLHPAAEANLLRTAALLAEDEAALDAGCGAAAGRARRARDRGGRSRRRTPSCGGRCGGVAGFPRPAPVAAERRGRAGALALRRGLGSARRRAGWPSVATNAS